MENTLKIAKRSSQQFHSALNRLSKIIITFLYTSILRFMILHCYSKKNNPVSLALRQGHFRVTGISLYIQILH